MRLKARTDKNQAAIVEALRKSGCLVFCLSSVGKGCPDLLVKLPCGQLLLIEVKSPKGKLTPDQERFQGQGWPVVILRSPDEVAGLVGDSLVSQIFDEPENNLEPEALASGNFSR